MNLLHFLRFTFPSEQLRNRALAPLTSEQAHFLVGLGLSVLSTMLLAGVFCWAVLRFWGH